MPPSAHMRPSTGPSRVALLSAIIMVRSRSRGATSCSRHGSRDTLYQSDQICKENGIDEWFRQHGIELVATRYNEG